MGCAFPVSRVTASLPEPIFRTLRLIPHALFSLVFPDNCRVCNCAITEITRYPVCESCIASVRPLDAEFFCVLCRTPFVDAASLDETGRCAVCREYSRGFDAAYSYGSYDTQLRELIHLFKYRRVIALARPLGRLISSALPLDEAVDVVVPVPMHWTRQWSRGFNQAERLAHRVARARRVPVIAGLARVKRTAPQAGLTHGERQQNMERVFAARHVKRFAGCRVLLVDDVFTTGATAGACANALKEAGARSVVLLTLARVDRRRTDIPDREHSTEAS